MEMEAVVFLRPTDAYTLFAWPASTFAFDMPGVGVTFLSKNIMHITDMNSRRSRKQTQNSLELCAPASSILRNVP